MGCTWRTSSLRPADHDELITTTVGLALALAALVSGFLEAVLPATRAVLIAR